MSAMPSDEQRVQEIYDIVTQTLADIEDIQLTRECFINPKTSNERLIVEGLEARIMRATEEGGKLSDKFSTYGFALKEMGGLRNRLIHAYGSVNREILWEVLEVNFPELEKACLAYCQDAGLDISPTWV